MINADCRSLYKGLEILKQLSIVHCKQGTETKYTESWQVLSLDWEQVFRQKDLSINAEWPKMQLRSL